jgi:hypothetical protein
MSRAEQEYEDELDLADTFLQAQRSAGEWIGYRKNPVTGRWVVSLKTRTDPVEVEELSLRQLADLGDLLTAYAGQVEKMARLTVDERMARLQELEG